MKFKILVVISLLNIIYFSSMMAQTNQKSAEGQVSPEIDKGTNTHSMEHATSPAAAVAEPSSNSAKEPQTAEGAEFKPPEPIYQIFESSVDYIYQPVGKRDPFRPHRDAKVGVGLVRTVTRPPEPLEKFDLKTLEVVAIVWDTDHPKALIQDPTKGVHSVVKGQRIGKNEGYIAEIREGEIVVIEMFELNGKPVKEPFVMCIDKTKGCGS